MNYALELWIALSPTVSTYPWEDTDELKNMSNIATALYLLFILVLKSAYIDIKFFVTSHHWIPHN